MRLGEGRLHELPSQRDLVAGVAAFSHTVLSPGQLPGILDQAFTVFGAGRPRPVHIELPLDVITAPGDGISRRLPDLPGRPTIAPRPPGYSGRNPGFGVPEPREAAAGF